MSWIGGSCNRVDAATLIIAGFNVITFGSLYEGPIALIALDVDCLDAVNCSDGHRAGDIALRRVSSLLRSFSRASHLAGRIQGSQFALLLPAGSWERTQRCHSSLIPRSIRVPVTSNSSVVTLASKSSMRRRRIDISRAMLRTIRV